MRFSNVFGFSTLLLALVLGSCTTFEMASAAPPQAHKILVNFSTKAFGTTDLPMGVYHVPHSQVVITGREVNTGIGESFGLLGVAVEDAIITNANKQGTTKIKGALDINLTTQARQDTRKFLQNQKPIADKFTLSKNPTLPVLTVKSAVVISYVDDDRVRPYVELKATLRNPNSLNQTASFDGPETSKGEMVRGNIIWESRYFISAGVPKPLTGANSWTANGGVELKDAVSQDLKKALEFMFTDIASPIPRTDSELMSVQGYVPYLRWPVKMVAYVLKETGDSIYVVPKVDDALAIAGTHIMDKSVTTVSKKSANEAPLTLLGQVQ
ncbi:MAG: hypothetical protein HKM06_08215 [Spirochaetales bacterium]|nr:hypothetical protein [Spirochaetales bacterium]